LIIEVDICLGLGIKDIYSIKIYRWLFRSGFMENTAAVSLCGRLSLEPAYDNGVYRVKAEVLTGIKIIWQYCREIGNNLFVPQEKIVEIRGHVLTGIQRKLIGHAARAYVP